MPQVDVFGTYHIDCPNKVKDELIEFAQETDVFFVEAPYDPVSTKDEMKIFLRNPLILFAGLLLDILWGSLGFLLTRSFGPVDATVIGRVAEKYGIDIAPVDVNLIQRSSEVSLLISVTSWILFVLILLLIAFGILFTSFGIIAWGLFIGILPIIPLAYLTLDERDGTMAKNIENTLKTSDDIERGCLVVGHKHMSGVVEDLKQRDVEVGKQHKSKVFRRSE